MGFVMTCTMMESNMLTKFQYLNSSELKLVKKLWNKIPARMLLQESILKTVSWHAKAL